MPHLVHKLIIALIIFIAITTGVVVYSPTLRNTVASTLHQKDIQSPVVTLPTYNEHTGKYVLVHLEDMTVELRDGTTTLATMPVISQGKPGSYYETIGGYYTNDYKIRTHFSSIGHVYMPYSVHVFGNFFIHGIPYYPDGQKVSSAYSGGCIRLTDADAQALYTFVEKGTPIIITRGDEYSFEKESIFKENTDALRENIDMTRLMVATISLDVLTQDNEFQNPYTYTQTTRRKLIPDLLVDKDDRVSSLYAGALGEKTYLDYMNQKAQAIGLSDTVFTSVTQPVLTSQRDIDRFMNYITTYKSYLLVQASSTTAR